MLSVEQRLEARARMASLSRLRGSRCGDLEVERAAVDDLLRCSVDFLDPEVKGRIDVLDYLRGVAYLEKGFAKLGDDIMRSARVLSKKVDGAQTEHIYDQRMLENIDRCWVYISQLADSVKFHVQEASRYHKFYHKVHSSHLHLQKIRQQVDNFVEVTQSKVAIPSCEQLSATEAEIQDVLVQFSKLSGILKEMMCEANLIPCLNGKKGTALFADGHNRQRVNLMASIRLPDGSWRHRGDSMYLPSRKAFSSKLFREYQVETKDQKHSVLLPELCLWPDDASSSGQPGSAGEAPVLSKSNLDCSSPIKELLEDWKSTHSNVAGRFANLLQPIYNSKLVHIKELMEWPASNTEELKTFLQVVPELLEYDNHKTPVVMDDLPAETIIQSEYVFRNDELSQLLRVLNKWKELLDGAEFKDAPITSLPKEGDEVITEGLPVEANVWTYPVNNKATVLSTSDAGVMTTLPSEYNADEAYITSFASPLPHTYRARAETCSDLYGPGPTDNVIIKPSSLFVNCPRCVEPYEIINYIEPASSVPRCYAGTPYVSNVGRGSSSVDRSREVHAVGKNGRRRLLPFIRSQSGGVNDTTTSSGIGSSLENIDGDQSLRRKVTQEGGSEKAGKQKKLFGWFRRPVKSKSPAPEQLRLQAEDKLPIGEAKQTTTVGLSTYSSTNTSAVLQRTPSNSSMKDTDIMYTCNCGRSFRQVDEQIQTENSLGSLSTLKNNSSDGLQSCVNTATQVKTSNATLSTAQEEYIRHCSHEAVPIVRSEGEIKSYECQTEKDEKAKTKGLICHDLSCQIGTITASRDTTTDPELMVGGPIEQMKFDRGLKMYEDYGIERIMIDEGSDPIFSYDGQFVSIGTSDDGVTNLIPKKLQVGDPWLALGKCVATNEKITSIDLEELDRLSPAEYLSVEEETDALEKMLSACNVRGKQSVLQVSSANAPHSPVLCNSYFGRRESSISRLDQIHSDEDQLQVFASPPVRSFALCDTQGQSRVHHNRMIDVSTAVGSLTEIGQQTSVTAAVNIVPLVCNCSTKYNQDSSKSNEDSSLREQIVSEKYDMALCENTVQYSSRRGNVYDLSTTTGAVCDAQWDSSSKAIKPNSPVLCNTYFGRRGSSTSCLFASPPIHSLALCDKQAEALPHVHRNRMIDVSTAVGFLNKVGSLEETATETSAMPLLCHAEAQHAVHSPALKHNNTFSLPYGTSEKHNSVLCDCRIDFTLPRSKSCDVSTSIGYLHDSSKSLRSRTPVLCTSYVGIPRSSINRLEQEQYNAVRKGELPTHPLNSIALCEVQAQSRVHRNRMNDVSCSVGYLTEIGQETVAVNITPPLCDSNTQYYNGAAKLSEGTLSKEQSASNAYDTTLCENAVQYSSYRRKFCDVSTAIGVLPNTQWDSNSKAISPQSSVLCNSYFGRRGSSTSRLDQIHTDEIQQQVFALPPGRSFALCDTQSQAQAQSHVHRNRMIDVSTAVGYLTEVRQDAETTAALGITSLLCNTEAQYCQDSTKLNEETLLREHFVSEKYGMTLCENTAQFIDHRDKLCDVSTAIGSLNDVHQVLLGYQTSFIRRCSSSEIRDALPPKLSGVALCDSQAQSNVQRNRMIDVSTAVGHLTEVSHAAEVTRTVNITPLLCRSEAQYSCEAFRLSEAGIVPTEQFVCKAYEPALCDSEVHSSQRHNKFCDVSTAVGSLSDFRQDSRAIETKFQSVLLCESSCGRGSSLSDRLYHHQREVIQEQVFTPPKLEEDTLIGNEVQSLLQRTTVATVDAVVGYTSDAESGVCPSIAYPTLCTSAAKYITKMTDKERPKMFDVSTAVGSLTIASPVPTIDHDNAPNPVGLQHPYRHTAMISSGGMHCPKGIHRRHSPATSWGRTITRSTADQRLDPDVEPCDKCSQRRRRTSRSTSSFTIDFNIGRRARHRRTSQPPATACNNSSRLANEETALSSSLSSEFESTSSVSELNASANREGRQHHHYVPRGTKAIKLNFYLNNTT